MNKNINKTAQSIINGMKQAIAYAQDDEVITSKVRIHEIAVPIINVYSAREKLGLTQKLFAMTFGVSLSTVRNWEQGRRNPTGAAKVLLNIIQKEPEAVKRVLSKAS